MQIIIENQEGSITFQVIREDGYVLSFDVTDAGLSLASGSRLVIRTDEESLTITRPFEAPAGG